MQPKVLVSTPNLVAASLGDELHISCFRGTLTMADVLAAGDIVDQYRAKLGKPIAELVVIEPSVGIPEEVVRQRLARRMKIRDSLTLGTVMVFEATGFFAATVRSMLTAMQLASRRKTPMRVYATLPEATQFLRRSSWLTLPPEAILQAVATIRGAPRLVGQAP